MKSFLINYPKEIKYGKRILIDASHKKQTRVAITSDKRVDGYEFEDCNKSS